MPETYTIHLSSKLDSGTYKYSSVVWDERAGDNRSGAPAGTKTFKDENELRSVLAKIPKHGSGIDSVLKSLRDNGIFDALPPVGPELARDFGWGASG
jgi:hypothetical protein